MKTCPIGILLLLLLTGCGSTDKPTAPSQPNLALSGAPPVAPSQPNSEPAPMAPAAQLPTASQTPNMTDSVAKAKALYEENVYSQGEDYAASLALRQCGIRRGSQAAKDFFKAIGKEPPPEAPLPRTSSQTNLSTETGGFKMPEGK